jgi:hypothetical protein
MPDHDVRITTKRMVVKGIDVDFDVKVDDSVLGTLSISEGGLRWRSRNQQARFGEQISWSDFAAWAESS